MDNKITLLGYSDASERKQSGDISGRTEKQSEYFWDYVRLSGLSPPPRRNVCVENVTEA